MLAANFVTTIAEAEAKIQAYVGRFLSSREKINRLVKSSDPDISTRASKLLAKQLDLESRLPGQLKVLDQVKAGVYSIGSIISLGTFGSDLVSHVRDVDSLREPTTASAGGFKLSNMSPTQIFIMIGLAGLGLRAIETVAKVRKK